MPGVGLDERVRQLVAGGEQRLAATEAIRGLGPAVLRFLRSELHDEDDAGDAFSLFAEDLWKSLPGFRGESPLRTWAFRLAVHASSRIRQQAWRRRVRRFAPGEASAIAAEVRTASGVVRDRRSVELTKLRETLRPADYTLLILRVDQNLSWNEIAAILVRSSGPVSAAALCKRFERIKARLRQTAHREGMLDHRD
jgi:RNA polymerase sigma-70 factor, ECF subfamily